MQKCRKKEAVAAQNSYPSQIYYAPTHANAY